MQLLSLDGREEKAKEGDLFWGVLSPAGVGRAVDWSPSPYGGSNLPLHTHSSRAEGTTEEASLLSIDSKELREGEEPASLPKLASNL